jgi:transcriptional regulator GlxA family with amidase domain
VGTGIWIVVTPGVMLLDLAGPAEAFRLARRAGARLELCFCGPTSGVPTSLGLPLAGLEPLPEALAPEDVVVVAGCEDSARHYARPEAARVVTWLRGLPAATRTASVCSGAILLARAGRLDGRSCTTHHTLVGRLRAEAPRAHVEEDRIFVEDGPVLSSAGITACRTRSRGIPRAAGRGPSWRRSATSASATWRGSFGRTPACPSATISDGSASLRPSGSSATAG